MLEKRKEVMMATEKIVRQVEVELFVSAEECARTFAHADSQFQVQFLNELGRLASQPQGSGGAAWWPFQCGFIASGEGHGQKVSKEGKHALASLFDYICEESEVL